MGSVYFRVTGAKVLKLANSQLPCVRQRVISHLNSESSKQAPTSTILSEVKGAEQMNLSNQFDSNNSSAVKSE